MNRRLLPNLRPGSTNWAQLQADFRWNIPQTFNIAERCCDSWAARDPNRIAITHLGSKDQTTFTYGQLKRASDGLAASLRARGVTQGDRVAVFIPQAPEVLITHLAAYKLGAIALPLFSLFGADALEYRLRDSGARAIVTDCANLDKVVELARNLPELSLVYCIDSAPDPVLDFWSEVETSHQFSPVQTFAEDPACLIYTSGTTGDPKGVLHAHRFLLGHLPAIETLYDGFNGPGAVGWTPADWAWIGGLMDLAMPCLYYGVPLISARMRKFDPDAAFSLLAKERVTAAFLPPTALKLMRQTKSPSLDLSLRAVFSGGESLGAELLHWGSENLGAPINEGYGQTECNLVLGTSANVMEVRPGSIGKAKPGHQVAVIDGDGNPVNSGEIGEIAVARPDPVMFLKYWNKPGRTTEKFAGNWMRTGDMGRQDDDGYFWFIGRDDDVITSAGYRIGPTEIENCLLSHPDVANVAVVGVPDPVRTEAVKAFVVLRNDAVWEGLEAQLVQLVRDRISPHVAPRFVERIDTLPLTSTGKVMRRKLRQMSR